jgi:uncharacterized coiled-coil protein SlyX
VKSRNLKSRWYLLAAMAFAAALPAAQSQSVHGHGTANQVPLWTGSTTIGNSALTQSGSNLTTSGSFTAASFAGDGSALTNVNAAKLGGILPGGFAQLSAGSNTFTGSISASTVNSTNPYQIGGTNVLKVDAQANLFVGQQAGNSNTTGEDNTASGFNALVSNTTGTNNTASGFAALGSNNTGTNNTASGADALVSNTTGSWNTASGFESGLGLVSGNLNIMLGFQAGLNFTSNESYNIDIGNQGVTGDGTPTFHPGVIRIGTDVTQDPNCSIGCQAATYIAAINGVTTGSATTSTVLVDSHGQLGTIASSRRYKEDIKDMGASSDGLLHLRPVTFRYKKPYADGSKPIQYGLVAEEVAEVYPDLVVRGKDGQVETVQYYKLDAMLLNEVQKLAKAHAADQAEIAQLQSQIAEQRKQGKKQQAAMRQLLSQVHGIQMTLASSRSARPHRRVARVAAHKATGPEAAAALPSLGPLRR